MWTTSCNPVSGNQQSNRGRKSLILVALLQCFFYASPIPAAESGSGEPPVLQVPRAESRPVMDGKLDDPCWQTAACTGPLGVVLGKAGNSATEVLLLLDADHLYVGLRCTGKLATAGVNRPGEPDKSKEYADLLIDSNADRNSCYLIRIDPEGSGTVTCSYNEHTPPWHDRTWQPKFDFAVTRTDDAWIAECTLPFDIFCKNKRVAPEIGFNVRRFRIPGEEVHGWHGAFDHPAEWGVLTGIPARDRLPAPDYALPKPDPSSSAAQWGVTTYRPAPLARRTFLAEQQGQTIALGPGSTHPGATGEVRLELEGWLLAGDPHSCGIIWDLTVDQRSGEVYILSDPRQVREAPELRVFDREGQYLRTIMPFSPTLPRASVEDLCGRTAREAEQELTMPKLFETLCGSLSLYGAFWHLPQKIIRAPSNDLLLANIYRGTLWRMNSDGSLPAEGWTSVYHHGRNEPFESHDWTQDVLNVQDLKNYLSFPSLHYPYFCFDKDGYLYVSAGQSSRPTKRYGYHWEVSQQEVTYQREVNGAEGRRAYVWKYRVHPGVKLEEVARGAVSPNQADSPTTAAISSWPIPETTVCRCSHRTARFKQPSLITSRTGRHIRSTDRRLWRWTANSTSTCWLPPNRSLPNPEV